MKKILVLLITVLLITGCGKTLEKPKEEKPKDEIPVIPEKPKLKIVNEDSKSRPIAVMVNNHPVARPNHAGLQDAFIVYEIIVEGGFTRMMALYKDQKTERIGSLRSSRHYFLDYALENSAIYVHFGWSPQAQSDIPKLGVNNINFLYDGGSYRDKTLGVALEHTAFAKLSDIEATIAKKKYKTETKNELLLNYSIDKVVLPSATPATDVLINYSSVSKVQYKYDATNGVYLRSFNDVKHTDGVSKKQYTAKNIIVTQIANSSIDSYGRQTLSNIGSGDGFYITNGQSVPIKWSKASRSAQTKYTYLDGTEISLNDGNTYIQIQPKGRELVIK